jgi:GNAT superfamily N-acetyltransferase
MTAAASGAEPRTVRLVERSVLHPDASAMLKAFYNDQVARYGRADPVDLNPEEFEAPNGIFVVVYRGQVPVGCGGCRWYDRKAGVAEIKKTYVSPAARGAGVGLRLLQRLEADARDRGAERLTLETGVRNSAALALFSSAGYEPAAPYVPHRDPDINRAFTKRLIAPSYAASNEHPI